MLFVRRLLFVVSALFAASSFAQNTRQPHIGYVYPAGGKQGTVIRITAGGQFLNGVTEALVSGEGVHASVIQYMQPLQNISMEQRQLLQRRLKEVQDRRIAEISSEQQVLQNSQEKPALNISQKTVDSNNTDSEQPEVKLPAHPLLFDLDNKSLKEIDHIRNIIFAPRRKQQPNRQISEMVLIEVTIDSDAEPGSRELRLITPSGLTNPIIFQVGSLLEICELEPNNRQNVTVLPKEETIEIPAVLNGQILPGDIDCFRFRANQGQNLVVDVHARSLIPYLADAVPGWFQATVALYDINGKELAFVDDYRFTPDPVLYYTIPYDGEYLLEIHDSIYRGREDFIYRITIGELPFVTQMFPLGSREGVKTNASIDGWNLSENQLALDTRPGDNSIRQITTQKDKLQSNSIIYSVNRLPECEEEESNNTLQDAQSIELPKIINGRIDCSGDIDVFRFSGHTGDKVVAEVYGRRLNSPLDSLLRLKDESGKVIEWNDDYVIVDNYLYKDLIGLNTHHADSYIKAELPQDGIYYIQLADTQSHGGMEYAYRLRISAEQPDFALRITPSSLFVRSGGYVPIDVYAVREDGFNGEIEVVIIDAPAGFELDGSRIPAGSDHIRMTLKAPVQVPNRPIALHMEGRAQIAGQTVTHPAVPAENMMQAFLYRHLVPAHELLVLVNSSKFPISPIKPAHNEIVRIPAGGTGRILLKTVRRPNLQEFQLELNEPPSGVTLSNLRISAESIEFDLNADSVTVKNSFSDNIIVEVFREVVPKQQEGKPTPQSRRTSIGFLPAIPIEVVTK
jgi:hypothetical protein